MLWMFSPDSTENATSNELCSLKIIQPPFTTSIFSTQQSILLVKAIYLAGTKLTNCSGMAPHLCKSPATQLCSTTSLQVFKQALKIHLFKITFCYIGIFFPYMQNATQYITFLYMFAYILICIYCIHMYSITYELWFQVYYSLHFFYWGYILIFCRLSLVINLMIIVLMCCCWYIIIWYGRKPHQMFYPKISCKK